MNEALKDVLQYLLHNKIIGGKHIPERIALSNISALRPYERREFFKDYKSLINQGYIFKQKKRTGKGYEEHISLNTAYVDDMKSWIKEYLEEDGNGSLL
jgi:hypothetical protein